MNGWTPVTKDYFPQSIICQCFNMTQKWALILRKTITTFLVFQNKVKKENAVTAATGGRT